MMALRCTLRLQKRKASIDINMSKAKKTNPIAVAMRKRHPRNKKMNSPNNRRQKDFKNSSLKDILEQLDFDNKSNNETEQNYNPDWRATNPDWLWQLPSAD